MGGSTKDTGQQRRVYVLPTELVERIVSYQRELGFTSEVEAARRLLEDALKSRDTHLTIIPRLLARYSQVRSMRDAAREVLVDHPLVKSISFPPEGLEFSLANSFRVVIGADAKATI